MGHSLSPIGLEAKKRPDGILILAALWTIGAVLNIFQGLNGIDSDLEILSYLSSPNLAEWFRFGIPAETTIRFLLIAFGFLTLLVVYGLCIVRSWSYRFSLAIPLLVLLLNAALVGLCLSAPYETIRAEGRAASPIFAIDFVWTTITWVYLRQRHAKQYLLFIPSPPPPPFVFPPIISATKVKDAQKEKKFCRFCGAENKTDATFCEKCGSRIRGI